MYFWANMWISRLYQDHESTTFGMNMAYNSSPLRQKSLAPPSGRHVPGCASRPGQLSPTPRRSHKISSCAPERSWKIISFQMPGGSPKLVTWLSAQWHPPNPHMASWRIWVCFWAFDVGTKKLWDPTVAKGQMLSCHWRKLQYSHRWPCRGPSLQKLLDLPCAVFLGSLWGFHGTFLLRVETLNFTTG